MKKLLLFSVVVLVVSLTSCSYEKGATINNGDLGWDKVENKIPEDSIVWKKVVPDSLKNPIRRFLLDVKVGGDNFAKKLSEKMANDGLIIPRELCSYMNLVKVSFNKKNKPVIVEVVYSDVTSKGFFEEPKERLTIKLVEASNFEIGYVSIVQSKYSIFWRSIVMFIGFLFIILLLVSWEDIIKNKVYLVIVVMAGILMLLIMINSISLLSALIISVFKWAVIIVKLLKKGSNLKAAQFIRVAFFGKKIIGIKICKKNIYG